VAGMRSAVAGIRSAVAGAIRNAVMGAMRSAAAGWVESAAADWMETTAASTTRSQRAEALSFGERGVDAFCMRTTLSHALEQAAGHPLLAALIVALTLGIGLGCGDEPSARAAATPAAAEDFVWPAGPNPRVTLHVAGKGDIVIELYPELAPKTVENFLMLARKGFYDGTTFHRVLPGFMIQGGDPLSRDKNPANDGMGNAKHKIDDEISDAPHVRGVVSMANKGSPNSASCQFFVVHADSRHLDGSYTAFGRVVDGIEVVDAIAAVETDQFGRWGTRARPLENVVISGLSISGTSETAARPGTPPAAS